MFAFVDIAAAQHALDVAIGTLAVVGMHICIILTSSPASLLGWFAVSILPAIIHMSSCFLPSLFSSFTSCLTYLLPCFLPPTPPCPLLHHSPAHLSRDPRPFPSPTPSLDPHASIRFSPFT